MACFLVFVSLSLGSANKNLHGFLSHADFLLSRSWAEVGNYLRLAALRFAGFLAAFFLAATFFFAAAGLRFFIAGFLAAGLRLAATFFFAGIIFFGKNILFAWLHDVDFILHHVVSFITRVRGRDEYVTSEL